MSLTAAVDFVQSLPAVVAGCLLYESVVGEFAVVTILGYNPW